MQVWRRWVGEAVEVEASFTESFIAIVLKLVFSV